MSGLLRLFGQIALLRRGPQDLPASPALLAMTVIGYLLINFLVSSIIPPGQRWLPLVLVETVFVLAWYAAMLRIASRSERFLQTATAVFGYQLVLAPLSLALQWMLARAQGGDSMTLFVTIAVVLTFVWILAVNGHIVRAALEWPLAGSIGLVLLQYVALYLLLATLFPQAAPVRAGA